MILTLTADNGDVIWTDPEFDTEDLSIGARGRVLMMQILMAHDEYQEDVGLTS